MNSFNDGIEAAAKRLREISHEGLKDSWWRERFESAARSVEALKRPEPSEGQKLAEALLTLRVAGVVTDAEKEKVIKRLQKRAALKAMEGE